VYIVSISPCVKSNALSTRRCNEVARDSLPAQIVEDIMLGGPVFETLMIALKAGAHCRSRFVDHDAPACARQRDCRGEARWTRPDDLKLFVTDGAAHLSVVV
jgi:hypothetical protein